MSKSLAAIQRQIEKLQKEAETIKSKEIAGVVERIRTAIQFYGLTAADLFGPATAKSAQATKTTRKTAKSSKVAAPKAAKAPPVIKYKDDAGNTWTGHGKRPNWFKAAIEAGKTIDELKVQA